MNTGNDVIFIVALGTCVSDEGILSPDALSRAKHAAEVYHKLHKNSFMIVVGTGGTSETFNITDRELYEYFNDSFLSFGVPSINIGYDFPIPSNHTVDDAILTVYCVRDLLEQYSKVSVNVVTSEFHAQRSSYLFRKAFEVIAGKSFEIQFHTCPNGLEGEDLIAARMHESRSLELLMSKPYGTWKDFLVKNNL